MNPNGFVLVKKARSAAPSCGPAHPKIVGDKVMRCCVSPPLDSRSSWLHDHAALAPLAEFAAQIGGCRPVRQRPGLDAIEDSVPAQIDLDDVQVQILQQIRIFLLELSP